MSNTAEHRSETPEEAPARAATEAAPEARPIGIVAPEWALQRSQRGAALWRHAGAMNASAKEAVEVLALDQRGIGKPFVPRDQWNVPATGARFRVRRVPIGGRTARVGELERARLEGLVLEWMRERRPRLAHVLDLDVFGVGLLWALEAVGVPTLLTLERADALRATLAMGGADPEEAAAALATVRRIVVRSSKDAGVAQALGAPREKIRVLSSEGDSDLSALRAYASLYRLIGGEPAGGTSSRDVGTSSGGPSAGAAA